MNTKEIHMTKKEFEDTIKSEYIKGYKEGYKDGDSGKSPLYKDVVE